MKQMLLNIMSDFNNFFKPVIVFFEDLWNSIHDFLLQYMSEDVFNIFIFIIIIAIILFIVLAIINRD